MGALGKAKAATVILERPDGRKLAADAGRGLRPRHEAPRLQLRQVQDAARTTTATPGRRPVDDHDRRRRTRARRGAPGRSRSAVADGVLLARDLVNEPANVLGPVEFAARAGELAEARRRGRDPRREGPEEARHGARSSASRRGRCGRRGSWSCAGTAARRRTSRSRFIGKGVVFDTGGISIKPAGRHGGHEGRHGRRRGRHRPDARARRAQGEGQRHRHHRPGREHAGRRRAAAGRHRHRHVRQDHRDHQHRRRRPPRARRPRRLCRGPLQAAVHDRPRDADRRDHRRARPSPCRAVRQRRRARRTRCSRPASRPASWSGGCRSARTTTS